MDNAQNVKKFLDYDGLTTFWNLIKGQLGSTATDIKYQNDKIYLVDSKGNMVGSGFNASEFVVDGMLSTVEFETVDGVKTNNLVFTFNTDSGKLPITVDFSKFIDVYSADETSLTLDNQTKKFSVKEVKANKTKLGQKVTVAGGPLADNIDETDNVWPDDWKDTESGEKFIPADATMYDIVMNLFCKELWPTDIETIDASITPLVENPSLTYNGKTVDSTAEVCSSVNYSISNGASSYTEYPHKATGLTYGYSNSNDNSKDSSNTEVKASFNDTVKVKTNSKAELWVKLPSDTAFNENTAATSSADAGTVTISDSVTIAEGDNYIETYCKSVEYSGTCGQLNTVFGCSNLGNTDEKYKSVTKIQANVSSGIKTSDTIKINCKGAYKVFVGHVDTVPTTSADVRAMNTYTRIGKGRIVDGNLVTADKGFIAIAIPEGWDFTIQNSMNQDTFRGAFNTNEPKTVSVMLPDNKTTKTYKVWYTNGNGTGYKNLVIV